MVLTTTETIPNKNIIEALGIARGSTVRARNVGRDIFASFNTLSFRLIQENKHLLE